MFLEVTPECLLNASGGCFRDVTDVLQLCYKGVARALHRWCRVLQRFYRVVTDTTLTYSETPKRVD